MAVGYMVHHLPKRPTLRPVGRIERNAIQARTGGFKAIGELRNLIDPTVYIGWLD